jgi:S-methylmethionine-dependent homocysteine/selenocysteine methylase
MCSISWSLPHQWDRPFLTDGGIETSLIFDDGLDLPHFAAFHLLRDRAGRAALSRYYERYMAVAARAGLGFVLESPTWRASPDWAGRLGYSNAALADANADAIVFMHGLRARLDTTPAAMLVSGCVGPRGDGYLPGDLMTPEAAQAYHHEQIGVLAEAGCDLISAITMTNVPEAIGIARAATACGVPNVISFTVETDGRLPTGDTLEQAIGEVDAATNGAPANFMINCAHPTHFGPVIERGGAWNARLGGLRANASSKSHAALNEAADLDRGNPDELAAAYRGLSDRLPGLRVFGGCCGTDHHHLAAIATAIREGVATTG